MDTQQKISERIKKLLEERNLKIKPFGEKLGIHNLSRMLANERNWTIRNLEKIAGGLGVTVGALAYDFTDIPILLEVGDEPFLFPQEINKDRAIGVGFGTYFSGRNGRGVEDLCNSREQ